MAQRDPIRGGEFACDVIEHPPSAVAIVVEELLTKAVHRPLHEVRIVRRDVERVLPLQVELDLLDDLGVG